MSFPKSLQQPFRPGQILVGGGFRAFFAPYNATLGHASSSTSVGPNILDLQVQGPFNENAPPTNFNDLGWIDSYKMAPASKIGVIRSGYRGAVRAIYRGEVGETFDFVFKEMSRMALKIASGSEVFNLLSNPAATASTVGPLSSSGATAVALGASGYNASYTNGTLGLSGSPVLFLAANSGTLFTANTYIVCDDDYTAGTYGQVGAAGIPVFQNAVTDVDFIRKTSDFVARITSIIPSNTAGNSTGQDILVLNKVLVGGGNSSSSATQAASYGPDAAAKVQTIKGYLTREGGTFVTEWTALFTCTLVDTSQVAIYYPHVALSAFKGMTNFQIENIGTTSETAYQLETTMMAMAYDDPLDGETVVRYAAYYPAAGKDPQI